MLRETKIETGYISGVPAADPRITAYKGIPFAAPPVGENRWRAPQPAKSWDGVLKCAEFGPMSMQEVHMTHGVTLYEREWLCDPQCPMDEDCLYLNVWTPAMSADERMPVLVWYFGGALMMGAPNEMEFDGERLARRGIVVVTVNYRTNAFGFMCHPEITKEAPEAPANFGHLDQQFATRWVQRNIAAFGGDPENITIAGQSAGGGSVQAQLTSPQNEGFCQRAIIESAAFVPCYTTRPTLNLQQAEKLGEEFFEYMGVKTLEEARKLDAKYVRDKVFSFGKRFGRVTDGKFSVDNSLDMLLRGECLKVPLMIGHTKDESHGYCQAESKEAFIAYAKERFGDRADKFIELCGGENATLEQLIEGSHVHISEVAVRSVCEQWTKHGQNAYYYRFGAPIPGWDNPGDFHSSDLWFFFETLAKCWRPFKGMHYDLARQMCNYWAYFVKNGDPNGVDADGLEMPHWSAYGEDGHAMYFAEVPQGEVKRVDEITKFFMDEVREKI